MIAALVAMSMFAAPVDPATASKLATNFLGNSRQSGMLKAPMGTSLELKKAEPSRVLGAGPVFYIYTTKYSYVVVAGDDRAEQILAYGDYALDVNNMPPGMKDMLNQYKDEIEYLQKNPTLKVDPIVSPKNSPSLRSASVGPLLTCIPVLHRLPRHLGSDGVLLLEIPDGSCARPARLCLHNRLFLLWLHRL